jgi:hypothetical protein
VPGDVALELPGLRAGQRRPAGPGPRARTVAIRAGSAPRGARSVRQRVMRLRSERPRSVRLISSGALTMRAGSCCRARRRTSTAPARVTGSMRRASRMPPARGQAWRPRARAVRAARAASSASLLARCAPRAAPGGRSRSPALPERRGSGRGRRRRPRCPPRPRRAGPDGGRRPEAPRRGPRPRRRTPPPRARAPLPASRTARAWRSRWVSRPRTTSTWSASMPAPPTRGVAGAGMG